MTTAALAAKGGSLHLTPALLACWCCKGGHRLSRRQLCCYASSHSFRHTLQCCSSHPCESPQRSTAWGVTSHVWAQGSNAAWLPTHPLTHATPCTTNQHALHCLCCCRVNTPKPLIISVRHSSGLELNAVGSCRFCTVCPKGLGQSPRVSCRLAAPCCQLLSSFTHSSMCVRNPTVSDSVPRSCICIRQGTASTYMAGYVQNGACLPCPPPPWHGVDCGFWQCAYLLTPSMIQDEWGFAEAVRAEVPSPTAEASLILQAAAATRRAHACVSCCAV